MLNKDEIRKLYDNRVISDGNVVESLGWRSKEQQFLRFEFLTRGLDFKLASILDIGCGYGDFISFLESKNIKFSKYVGIDLSAEMIKEAKLRFNNHKNTSFLNVDFASLTGVNVDYAIASGSLNYRLNENMELYLEEFIKKYSKKVNLGLLFNLLSTKVDYMQDYHMHYDPKIVESIVLKYFEKCHIFQNYGLYEFTIQGIK